MKVKNPAPTSDDIKKIMSYIGSIKTEKKAMTSRLNGQKSKGRRPHCVHVYPNGSTKCSECGFYKSRIAISKRKVK